MSLRPQPLLSPRVVLRELRSLREEHHLRPFSQAARRRILENLVLLKPWMFKQDVINLVGANPREIAEVYRKYGIDNKTIQTVRQELRRTGAGGERDRLNAIRNALNNIDPIFRPYYIGKNEVLSRIYTGLPEDLNLVVPLTEVYGYPDMETNLGKILAKNIRRVVINMYFDWKQIKYNIMRMLENGESPESIAKRYNMSVEEVMSIAEELRRLGSADNYKPNKLTREEEDEVDRIVAEIVMNVPEEIRRIRLCPAYASNDKSERGMQRMICDVDEKGNYRLFSRAAYNIPFLEWSPPKRVQIATHIIAKNRSNVFFPYGEAPIVKAEYNDLRGKGVNARVFIATDPEMFRRTYGGGLVITEGLAKKLTYEFRSPKATAFALSRDGFLPEGTYVRRGDMIVTDPATQIQVAFDAVYAPYEGYVHWLGPPKEHYRKRYGFKFYTRDYVIVRRSPIRVGDKLVSRTGLKGVVVDIVPGEEPVLWVNPLDVWHEMPEDLEEEGKRLLAKQRRGEKLTMEEFAVLQKYKKVRNKRKGAFIMELLHSARMEGAKHDEIEEIRRRGGGKMFVFPDAGGFAADYAASGLRLSWTFLMGYLEKSNFKELWKRYFFVGNRLKQLLKVLHLRLVKVGPNKYRLEPDPNEPEPDEYGEVVYFPHVMWFGTPYERRYNYIYMPYWLQGYYIDQSRNLRRFGIWEDMSDAEKRYVWNNALKRFVLNRIYEHMFSPKYGAGIDRKAVGVDIGLDEVLIDREVAEMFGLKEGDWVGVRKEPVTTGDSILQLRVRIDDTGKYKHVIGLNPATAEYATIDFDGDTVVLFVPPPGDEFIPRLSEEQKKVLEDIPSFYFSDEELRTCYRPLEKVAEEVKEYNAETRRIENSAIQRYGQDRRNAFLLLPKIAEYFPLRKINETFDIEQAMKGKIRDVSAEREIRAAMKQLLDQRNRALIQMFRAKKIRSPNQLVGLELDTNYLIDKLIVWNIMGDAAADEIRREFGLREIRRRVAMLRRFYAQMLRAYREANWTAHEREGLARFLRQVQSEYRRWLRLLRRAEAERRRKRRR